MKVKVNVRSVMVKDTLNANDAKARANVHVVMVEDISIAKNVGEKEKSVKIIGRKIPRNKMRLDTKPREISVLAEKHQHNLQNMPRHR